MVCRQREYLIMPYIDRDDEGRIESYYNCKQYEDQEFVDGAEQEVLDFLDPPETYIDKRLKCVAEGGYGTICEQLEMINEQG